jgi:hypothetical protein
LGIRKFAVGSNDVDGRTKPTKPGHDTFCPICPTICSIGPI